MRVTVGQFNKVARGVKPTLPNTTAPGEGDRRTVSFFEKLDDKVTAVRSGECVEFDRRLSVVSSQVRDTRCKHNDTTSGGIGR